MIYMLMSVPGGNMIGSWRDRDQALEAVYLILKREPEARENMILVGFDEDGIEAVWPPELI